MWVVNLGTVSIRNWSKLLTGRDLPTDPEDLSSTGGGTSLVHVGVGDSGSNCGKMLMSIGAKIP